MNEKIMQKITLALLLFIFVNLQTGKAQENKKVRKMLVGEWKIGDIQNPEVDISKMSEDDKKKFEEMMNEMKANSSYNFIQDGKYAMKMSFMGQETKKTGTWKVDKEGRTLITISEEGKDKNLSIEEISKNKLILKEGNKLLTLVK